MTRLLGLLVLFLVILIIQAVALTEAFASSQGGAQLQLAASRPVYYLADDTTRTVAMIQETQLNLQGPQPLYQGSPFPPSASSWISPY